MDPAKTLRQGALTLTTPNGYIIYSQVTMEVLDEVCRAHGFSVDIPWRDLTGAQQDIVLNGSDRIRIPYGKHPLESRLRWKGIVAKPREEGFYKGILPVMETTLKTKRNDNILRFSRTLPLPRLWRPRSQARVPAGDCVRPLYLRSLRNERPWPGRGLPAHGLRRLGRAAGESRPRFPARKTDLLERLELGHLRLDRAADTLGR